MSTTPSAASSSVPIQSTSTFNIQNLVTPSLTLLDTPVDISRLLSMLYQDVEQQITRADVKAQITLGTSTLLAALSANLGLGFASDGTGMMPVEWLAASFYALSTLCVFGSICCAVTAAFPRSVGRSKPPHDNLNLNLYFSADIVQLSPEEYVSRFLGQTNEQLKERVIKQIQIKGRVLERKLSFVRGGLRSLVIAIVLWALAHATLLFAYGRLVKG